MISQYDFAPLNWGIAQGAGYEQPVLIEADRIEFPDERPDPLAEPEGYGRRPGREPETDSETCVHGSCARQARWRLMLGDLSEHVFRLNLCDECALAHLSPAVSLTCAKCRQPMQVGRTEPMRGQPAGELETIRAARVQAAVDRLERGRS